MSPLSSAEHAARPPPTAQSERDAPTNWSDEIIEEQDETTTLMSARTKRILDRELNLIYNEFIEVLKALHKIGLDKTDKVKVGGVEVSPRDVVAACLPDPATLGDKMTGKTCAGLFVTGTGKVNSTDEVSPVAAVLRIASSTGGVRRIAETCLRSASTPTTSRITRFASITRPDASMSISGSGKRSRISRASAGNPAMSEGAGPPPAPSAAMFLRAAIAFTIRAATARTANAIHAPLFPKYANARAPAASPATAPHDTRRRSSHTFMRSVSHTPVAER